MWIMNGIKYVIVLYFKLSIKHIKIVKPYYIVNIISFYWKAWDSLSPHLSMHYILFSWARDDVIVRDPIRPWICVCVCVWCCCALMLWSHTPLGVIKVSCFSQGHSYLENVSNMQIGPVAAQQMSLIQLPFPGAASVAWCGHLWST